MATKTTSRRFVARGRVQGVFFRDSVRREAERTGVVGWVANRRDGDVEGVLEGEEEAVEGMLGFIRRGPGHAEVAELEVAAAEPEGFPGFRIA